MSHVKMKENKINPQPTYFVLDKKQISNLTVSKFWKLVSAMLFAVVIFLVLAVYGVFDTAETVTLPEVAEASSLKANNYDSANGDDEYLTGPIPPNMLFLLADDIGWADISYHGGQFDTPVIDELVTGGIELTNFYTQSLCTPSRMAFLTGRYPWKLGVQYPEVIHALMTGHIPANEKTFAEVTKEMGYENYYIGRWGVGYASWDYTPLGRGWDKFMGYFGPEGGYYNHSTDHFNKWTDVYDFWDMANEFLDANMTYSEDLFYERTIQYLEEANKAGKPFTLTYASQTAHAPIDDDWPTFYPPIIFTECHNEMEGREYFCNKVKYLDYIWGLIVDYLKDTGMWDNILVFVTTDNGALPYTEQDKYSDWGCNWPYRGGKVTHFEGGIKVWAGLTGGLVPPDYQGTKFDSMTHITDFAATAMRLSMTQSQFDGRKTLTGTERSPDGKNIYSLEHHELIVHNVKPHYVPSWINSDAFDYAATDGEWKYIVGVDDTAAQGQGWYNFPGYGVIDGDSDWKSFQAAGGNCSHGCLFHIVTDPFEYHDMSFEYPEVAYYFTDLIGAIYNGGLDESYHSGQAYEEDDRGWMADNILRPYLNSNAMKDYGDRVRNRNSAKYDYANAPLSYISDYDRKASPFDVGAESNG